MQRLMTEIWVCCSAELKIHGQNEIFAHFRHRLLGDNDDAGVCSELSDNKKKNQQKKTVSSTKIVRGREETMLSPHLVKGKCNSSLSACVFDSLLKRII